MGIKAEDFKVGQIWISRGQRTRVRIDHISDRTEGRVCGSYSTSNNGLTWIDQSMTTDTVALLRGGVWQTAGETEYGNIIYSPGE
jgi:hypothetical protein